VISEVKPSNEEKVFYLIPVNGLVNRLRAMSSSFIWASENGYRLHIIWKKSHVMNCDAELLFGPNLLNQFFLQKAPKEVMEFSLEVNPRFEFDENRSTVFIAGGRNGEQESLRRLKTCQEGNLENLSRIVVRSGGLFHDCAIEGCVDCESFRSKRFDFYSMLEFSIQVENEMRSRQILSVPTFQGIHIRQTDKTRDEQVSVERLARIVKKKNELLGISHSNSLVYICGDNASGITAMENALEKRGLNCIANKELEFDRNKSSSAISALVDWLQLARANYIVYYGNTSFGYEAAVKGNNFSNSIHLEPQGKVAIKLYLKIKNFIKFRMAQFTNLSSSETLN
jgi:hypothetical protein